ncbi:MAG: pyruvate kinase [Pseudomonadota bacterium]
MQVKFEPRQRRIRIVTTLGPASSSPEMIEQLFLTGADVFRLNMSHGDQDKKAEMVRTIRAMEDKFGRPTTILADLQGPKLRVGTFADGPVRLRYDQRFTLCLDAVEGDEERVCLPHPEIFEAAKSGMRLLLDDGRIQLEVTKVEPRALKCKVLLGGKLSDRKGVNVPDVVLPLAAMTDKDRRDLDFALEQKVDWIALSFVQRAEDVADLKKIVAGRAGVLSKIEKPAAMEALEEIVEQSDAVMVARGDLGVELPLQEVPPAQKRIIAAARAAGKMVVVATQMLESMVDAPAPTRAEVGDVANAVFEGADAVMLSAESAVGAHPLAAVRIMSDIAKRIEADDIYASMRAFEQRSYQATGVDAISLAARQVADTISSAAIVCYTFSGSTALRAARERTMAPIIALTPRMETARRLGLTWGLHSIATRDVENFEEMLGKAKRMALRTGLVKGGDRIVVTAGVPFGTPGSTNVLHIAWVQGDELDGHTVD